VLISAGRVITPAQVLAPGWVLVEGHHVVDVQQGSPPRRPDVDLPHGTVVPGFVDSHVHGGGGASFDSGRPEDAATAIRTHLENGTTTVTASLVTAAPASLSGALRDLAPLVEDGLLAGLHLEGPWLAMEHRGAHDPGLLTHPTTEDVEALVESAGGHLRMVTLAPELPGGLDAVRRLVAHGVVVAIGHTDATYDETRAALDAGASAGTHLFNAMRGIHHREPGPVAALLEHPSAFVELIADGVHLHPAVLRLAATRKAHQTVLVTDAMAAAGLGDGDYALGRLAVQVRDGVARLADGDGAGAIAGSTLTLAAAVKFAVRTAGLPIHDVIRAATTTPAAMLGLAHVGSLRPAAQADLVVLDADLEVQRVMHRGSWVQ
jgi:N-acetylglucosamine-6-phosphate deacetylase